MVVFMQDIENKEKIIMMYKSFNYIILFLVIYIILFPVVAKVLNYISPILTKCPYKEMFGKPCPLCGGTRYIANLKNVLSNPHMLLEPFGFIMMFVFFSLIFRIFCIFYLRKERKNIKKLMIVDFVILGMVIISFGIYELVFFLS